MTVDPKASIFQAWLPYNNLINTFDPDGEEGLFAIRMDMRNKRVINGEITAKQFTREAKHEFIAAASGLTIIQDLRISFVYLKVKRKKLQEKVEVRIN